MNDWIKNLGQKRMGLKGGDFSRISRYAAKEVGKSGEKNLAGMRVKTASLTKRPSVAIKTGKASKEFGSPISSLSKICPVHVHKMRTTKSAEAILKKRCLFIPRL